MNYNRQRGSNNKCWTWKTHSYVISVSKNVRIFQLEMDMIFWSM
jgi:hypothetical protein